MKTTRATAGLLLVLLVSLLLAGCGSEAVRDRERANLGVTENKRRESTSPAQPASAPLPKQIGDHVGTEFAKAANDIEETWRDFEERNRKMDKERLAALKEMGADLSKAGEPRLEWLWLARAINKAITSISDDPDKPVITVENLTMERRNDLSEWFGALPESATAKLNEDDRKTPPASEGWLVTLELTADAIDEQQIDTTLTEFAEILRKTKPADKLHLTHPVWNASREKNVIEFILQDK